MSDPPETGHAAGEKRRTLSRSQITRKDFHALMARVERLESEVSDQMKMLSSALAEMRDAQMAIIAEQRTIHEFYRALMVPALGDQKSLVEKIDALIDNVESGRRTSINIMQIAGFIAAVGAAWLAIRQIFISQLPPPPP